ncbi:MAG: AAA family ATPase [Algiphilus sp.]|uniref:AAA family ATPase n=1 Tax=Algiphilus sp. TaxID=1872431 RepID=UPI0025C091D1|nr:AAA family ATPase [Algiphilus sp.]MCI5104131.1 AAA family ATPase [Algiphilus sp.]
MQCPSCAQNNAEDARYCLQCGDALQIACPQCAHHNPPQARFCNQCGTRLQTAALDGKARDYTPRHLTDQVLTSRSALEGERKTVTVLFADLRGSTAAAEAVDDEHWHHILDRCFALLGNAVHRYEGTVNQYTGDGIMALFGAPIAHEDHALRACRAALDIQTDFRRFADGLRLSNGLNLGLRMGMHSGAVVVGKIGDDLRMDYTAKGPTVHLAARMEQIAESGCIYLTRDTAQQVEGYVRLRDLGAMTVKGLSTPVGVYELEGLGPLHSRLEQARQRGLSRFIGRQAERQRLEQALTDAQRGEGGVIAVTGEAGIGKSRLCWEIQEDAAARDIPVYTSACVPYAAALPMYPVLALLKSLFGIDDSDSPAEQRRKIAGTYAMHGHQCRESMRLLFEILDVAERDAAPSAIPPERRQEHLLALARALLTEGTQARLLVVEDVHWADRASQDFFTELAQAVPNSPTLMVLNYRSTESVDWLQFALRAQLQLEALSAQEMAALTTDLLGNALELTPIAQRLAEQAAGNPLFVEEAVRSLAEQGYLEGPSGAYRLREAAPEIVIPDTVQALLAARIDRLPEKDKMLLSHAAVIGKDFCKEQLAELLDWPAEAIDRAMERLEHGGFMHVGGADGEWHFRHPLTQEVAYRAQLREGRSAIHARLARLIEAKVAPEGVDERSLLLAHHWQHADKPLKALHWQIQAAVYEGAVRASSDAMARYRRAAEQADAIAAGAERDRLAAIARAGIVRTASLLRIPPEESAKAYEEGLALARQHDDQPVLAELLIAGASLELQQGDADVAVAQARQALEIAFRMQRADLVARFRIPILLAFFAAGQLEEAVSVLNAPGRPPWYEGPIHEGNFLSRAFRALILIHQGALGEAQRELRQAIAVEGETGRTVSWMHGTLVEIARVTEQPAMAMREARSAVERAERFSSPFFLAFAYRALGVALGLQGKWQEAVQTLEAHRDKVASGEAAHQFEALHLADLAQAYLHLGRQDDALATAEQALRSAQQAHARTWECHVRRVYAEILLARDDPDGARQHLDALDALVERTGATLFVPLSQCLRAHLPELQTSQRQALLRSAMAQFQAFGADDRARALRGRLPAAEAPLAS